MRFSAKAFLEGEVGSAQNVLALFTSFGVDAPPLDTIRKWYERDSISCARLVEIVCLLELDRGEPVSFAPFLN